MGNNRVRAASDSLERIAGLLESIANKLDAAMRIRIIGMTRGQSQSEQIWLFSLAGLQPREIAEILATSPNTVRVLLSNRRKLRRQRSARREGND